MIDFNPGTFHHPVMNHKRTSKRLFMWLALGWVGTTASAQNPEVHIHGALKNMMMHADISPQTSLSAYSGTLGWLGLGAVAGLKGEVLIWDGQPWVASASEDQIVLQSDPEAEATLLVASQVEDWQEWPVPRKVSSQEEFETFLAQTAEDAGLDVKQPFPFRLEGRFKTLAWHVVDWKEGDMEHTCEKHKTTGPHGVETDLETQLLGFHSLRHHRIFTHHSTNIHVHAWIDDSDVVAHVDGLILSKGVILLLPQPR